MKPNIIIRMGAAHWDARVLVDDGASVRYVRFDFRTMERKERSTFHREFMNGFRAARRVTA